ncbi:RTA1 domain-containing protein [Aspergillus clavatus NRRL 1]|uniref:RTA1 domain protein n=1 Tax=Aspergillus clavatus (strain ATCC 1007 / CBS 513.65 / DSM 816 / NCTC 3887 / NRRL 1 / QM 1276 / 107) TaxID=344612 RepID=A1CFN3_ASPCL|nr:RTA1 domain protein [Aspergillus clavatus NRRL 1]EAW11682.1 RTA1 domain protein [Aspergillus clavatus NRRL 1]
MRLSHSLLYSLLVSAIGVHASPSPTPVPDPTTLQKRAAATDPYDPQITLNLDLPPVSIPPVTIPPVTIPSLTLDLPTNTCTPTIAPDKNGWVPPTECNALYLYYPSFGAAIAFSFIFGVVMIAHFVQATIYKTGFVWVILMGATWECIGFVVRVLSTRDQQNSTLALITQLFILLSPLWVNAFDYMVLARMIHFFVPEKTIGIFKPSLLATIFVFLDLGSFIIQLIGGSMAGPGVSHDQQMNGIHIYMGGIGIQEFFIILFLLIAIQFHRRMLHLDRIGQLVGPKTQWRGLLYALYCSLLFITVRIIYRLVEFSSGNDASNPIPYHEWYVYAFDAVPMLFAIAVWNLVHPGKVLQGPDAKMPPSALRKICCCTACRKRKHKDMQKIPDSDPSGGDEMLPLRDRAPSPYR